MLRAGRLLRVGKLRFNIGDKLVRVDGSVGEVRRIGKGATLLGKMGKKRPAICSRWLRRTRSVLVGSHPASDGDGQDDAGPASLAVCAAFIMG